MDLDILEVVAPEGPQDQGPMEIEEEMTASIENCSDCPKSMTIPSLLALDMSPFEGLIEATGRAILLLLTSFCAYAFHAGGVSIGLNTRRGHASSR